MAFHSLSRRSFFAASIAAVSVSEASACFLRQKRRICPPQPNPLPDPPQPPTERVRQNIERLSSQHRQALSRGVAAMKGISTSTMFYRSGTGPQIGRDACPLRAGQQEFLGLPGNLVDQFSRGARMRLGRQADCAILAPGARRELHRRQRHAADLDDLEISLTQREQPGGQ